MQVVVNGENTELNDVDTIVDLLRHLDVQGKVAVEINREIVPRSKFESCTLNDGDVIEIVRAIGGG